MTFWVALSAIVAAAALVVSVVSLVFARRIGLRQTELQERLLFVEHGRDRDRRLGAVKANLRATVGQLGQSKALFVLNNGPAEATRIRLSLNGVLWHNNQLVARHEAVPEVLGLGANFRLRFVTYDGMQRSCGVELEWVDGSPEVGKWTSDLTL